MEVRDRRKHKRLPIKLGVVCQAVGTDSQALCRGTTVNVSTGGLLMETGLDVPNISVGNLIDIEVQVPPTAGTLEYGGRIAGFAKVIRVSRSKQGQSDSRSARQHIAMQFCQHLKLSL